MLLFGQILASHRILSAPVVAAGEGSASSAAFKANSAGEEIVCFVVCLAQSDVRIAMPKGFSAVMYVFHSLTHMVCIADEFGMD
jgi:hypothetical protein